VERKYLAASSRVAFTDGFISQVAEKRANHGRAWPRIATIQIQFISGVANRLDLGCGMLPIITLNGALGLAYGCLSERGDASQTTVIVNLPVRLQGRRW